MEDRARPLNFITTTKKNNNLLIGDNKIEKSSIFYQICPL